MSTWSIVNENLVNTRLECLSPAKQASYDSSLSTQISRRGCTEGTRIGVLDGLDDWIYDPTSSSIYWMNGMAGTGKTTIASTFCERIERRKLLAASFFCTRTSAECRDISRIVPTIAYQLARYSIPFQSALCNILGQNPDIGSKNVLKQFELLLKEPLQQVKDAMPDSLVVVIDALDECDDRNGVELVIDMLFRHAAHVPLKFMLTSRPEPEIYSKMATHAQSRQVIHLHDIEKSLVRADIELYLKEELGLMSPPASQAEIEQLVERAGTLFIYAATLIDTLYTAVLHSALNEDELETDETEDIRAVLCIVLFAQEPINVETIAELAEIDDPQRVIHALHPLRSVLHQSEEAGLVSTLHASFPDFMFSNERSGTYFYDVVEHSQLLAQRCFLVMKGQLRFNICDLASSFVTDKEVENIEERIKASIPSTLAYHAEPSPSELIIFVDDARSFLAGFAYNPASHSTPHIYISSLAFSSPSNLVYNHYQKRSRGLIKLQGSLIKLSDAAPLTSWATGMKINSLALSPDGARILIGCNDSTISILSAYDASVYVGPLHGHTDSVASVAFSPDGGRIVSASPGYIIIWNAHNGTLINDSFQGLLGEIESVSFSPDGTLLVSSGYMVQVWNAYDGTPVRRNPKSNYPLWLKSGNLGKLDLG
ncbi:vegetative incompatibility protein HET-E-1 [Rhizoctonia solani 123E]|uniref:Vegetative incompatibility protein HET-E-1 n=1 Tax=Rhizoctonia solani 123E TaxID=1423351 RepID=A0A074RK07_9AGAM|nr:vegetative incompatibility protein HET-E-1 [Rhizoctonia solani 123E]